MTPNAFAYAMLLFWPFVTIIIFKTMRPDRALIWSIMGGYLFLPPIANFDFPIIPPLDKMAIPSLSALAASMIVLGNKVRLLTSSTAVRILLVALIVAPIPTALTNTDPLFIAGMTLQPMTLYDGLSIAANQFIMIIPLILASQYLRTADSLRELIFALFVGGLIYSIPMLLEVRLSPQLNIWIYGFFQHAFDQMIRYDGFRPIVFLQHGLWVAFFALTSALAAFSIARTEPAALRARYFAAAIYLSIVLILCKSLAALLYAIALIPIVLVAGRRFQLRVAIVLMVIAVLYPVMRGNGIFPIDTILAYADMIDPDRAQSLGVRIRTEDALISRVNERPLFGWGGWGRGIVYSTEGYLESTVDGYWIIIFGSLGWFGYIGTFGLLGYVGLRTARQINAAPHAHVSAYAPILLLIQAINMIDMLLNATITPLTWLGAGALLGYSDAAVRVKAARPAPSITRIG